MTFGPVFQRTFQPPFDRRNTVKNGLLNNLIAYWPGNEANGNALDLHTNGITLTDNNTVTNAAGKVYATARQYTAANEEFHEAADSALLSLGTNSDFTVAAWAYFDTISTVTKFILCKRLTSGVTQEYQLSFAGSDLGGADRFRFVTSNGVATSGGVNATSLGLPSINTWYLVIGWHDGVADTVNIQVNNGTVDSAAYSAGTFDGTSVFRIGCETYNAAGFRLPMNGRVGPTMFWKSASGGGGVLTAAQRTALYNSGAGLAYANFTT